MSLSPLAERIYQTLIRQRSQMQPLISYGDLVRALGPLTPPNANLAPNDQRLFDALEEISRACLSHDPPLPAITSLVVRRNDNGTLGTPGGGYFALHFPQVWDEQTRVRKWRAEVARVVASPYPKELTPVASSDPDYAVPARRWSRDSTIIAAIIGVAGTLAAAIIPILVANRHQDVPPPGPAERPAATSVPQAAEPPQQPRLESPRAEKTVTAPLTLDGILDVLERHRQRATFGAVAGLLGREPQSLFNGYARTPRTAWVVSKTTGLPTGTRESDYPEGLLANKRVIETLDDLRAWLREHH